MRRFGHTSVLALFAIAAPVMVPCEGAATEVELNSEPSRLDASQPVNVPDPVAAQTTSKPVPAQVQPWALPIPLSGPTTFPTEGQVTLGGAFRVRNTTNFDNSNPQTGFHQTDNSFGLDTLILKGNYDSSTLFGSFQYNIYGGAYPFDGPGYQNYFGEVSFLKWAYGGVKLSKQDSITAGLQQVPFGIVPYFGTSFIETLAYVNGIEEFYDVGIKYSHVADRWNFQLGFFPEDGGNYFGTSKDSARYTANIVEADSSLSGGTNNTERFMLVGRSEYTFYKDKDISATAGASILHSSVFNYDTGQYGPKQEEALHFVGTYGPWTLRSVFSRLDIDPRNPYGQNSTVTMGSYDGSYNVATKSWNFDAELAYEYKPSWGLFSDVVPYADYNGSYKDQSNFHDSERYILGTELTVRNIKSIIIYSEFRFGRNDPYTGAGNFDQGMAAGGTNRWATTWETDIGYYF